MQLQTTVQDSQLQAKWDSFLQEHCQDMVVNAALDFPETRSVIVHFNDIQLRDPELADLVLQRPTHALRVGAAAMHQIDVPVEPRPRLHFRITGLPDSQRYLPRDLRAEHLGKFLGIDGLVKKVTEVRPMIHEACFECKFCANQEFVIQDEELLMEPVACAACEKTGPWRLREDECKYVDHQKVEIQENTDQLRGGAQPERLTIHLRDDLVHEVVPGDRIRMNGILTTQARRQGNMKRTEFNKLLMGVSIEVQQHDFEEIELTPEDEVIIRDLSKDPRVYERFRASFAPTIHGHDAEKDALILALFGGVAKHYKDGSRTRGDIHVLLVGDPGVAKSQLLRFMSKLAPRSIFTSGKSASAAGLTAAAVKDEFGEGQWTLEAGALVLADNGVACIDELDKMSSNDQSSMHQAMEQQEISIAKAGVSATLKSRCAVIGAANPKMGRFDDYAPIHEQINMPPPLLSRFDLIFSLRDKANRQKDDALASMILKTHKAGEVREHRQANPTGIYTQEDEEALLKNVTPDLDADMFRKYVAYAKRHVFPVLTDDALDTIREYYVDLRNSGEGGMPFTARQLEAFVRLAEASARLRLSQEANKEDAQRAIRVVEHFLSSVGMDKETGTFDMDIITTGVSHTQHDRMRTLLDVIKTLCQQTDGNFARHDDVVDIAMRDHGMSREQVDKGLETLRRNNSVYAKGGANTYAPL